MSKAYALDDAADYAYLLEKLKEAYENRGNERVVVVLYEEECE